MKQILGIIASSILKGVDPFVISITVEDANPNNLVIVLNEVVTGTNLGFTVGGTTSTTFDSISGSGTNTITGVLAVAVTGDETVLLSYNDAVGDIIDGSSNPLASFTDTAVINNVDFDSDAQAFIDAVGTLDTTNENAINQLVLDLKGFSIWTKLIVINPKAGSTAAEHKWNLKDPRDLDAAYRYTYSGTWVHSSGGAESNGTDAYADSHLNPNTLGMGGDISMGFYQRVLQTLTTDRHSMGAYSSANNWVGIQNQNLTRLILSGYAGSAVDFNPINSTPDQLGIYALSIISTTIKAYHQDETPASGTTNGTGVPNQTVFEGALNLSGSYYRGVDMTFGTSFIGDGLTDGEIANLRTAIITFETALGRDI